MILKHIMANYNLNSYLLNYCSSSYNKCAVYDGSNPLSFNSYREIIKKKEKSNVNY